MCYIYDTIFPKLFSNVAPPLLKHIYRRRLRGKSSKLAKSANDHYSVVGLKSQPKKTLKHKYVFETPQNITVKEKNVYSSVTALYIKPVMETARAGTNAKKTLSFINNNPNHG